MIPTIEQIVEDLAAGAVTKSQAVTLLHLHAEGAANELRDHFAAKAMANFTPRDYVGDDETSRSYQKAAESAYRYADAMLKARGQS